jgi:tRNA pseudouridine38-40 synthase
MGELRAALEPILKSEIELVGAGRTDAGVHARGQVAHVKYTAAKPAVEAFVLTQANLKLPAEISIRKLHKAPLAFHARHDATAREYVYQIATGKSAFEKKYVWWVKEPLDTAAMQAAAALIVGRHDFKCFQAQDPGRPNEPSIVVVERAAIEVLDNKILFRIEASHFVWRMVRRLTGVLVKIGLGEITLADLELLLQAKQDPRLDVAAWTAPSSGLFFERVRYS